MSEEASAETHDRKDQPKGKWKGPRKTPGNRDPRGVKPNDFEVGKYKPIIKSTTITVAGSFNEYTLDFMGALALSTTLGRQLVAVSERFRSGMIDPLEIEDACKRMMHIAIGKKLAFAADKESLAMYARELSLLRKAAIFLPLPFKRVAEGYGWFTYNGAAYRPSHSSLWAFNAFAHAVYQPGQDDMPALLEDGYFVVNTNHTNWKAGLLAMAAMTYNSWAEDSQIEINMNGFVTRPPHCVRGFQQLAALMVGAPLPEEIHQAIQVALAVENNLQNHQFPNQQERLALHELRIQVVTWTRERQEELLQRYVSVHQQRVSGLMQHIFSCEERVEKFEENGRPWQLMNHVGASVATHPFDLPQVDVEMGLVLQNHTRYRVNPALIQTASAESGETARDIYVRSHLRTEGHLI